MGTSVAGRCSGPAWADCCGLTPYPVMKLLADQPPTVEDILGQPSPTDPQPRTAASARGTASRPADSIAHSEETTMNESPFHREGLPIDQQLALRSAATRLQDSFEGVFNTETIERFLHHSYDEFAEHATITKWLPLLAERFARQRLNALARIEGKSDDTRPIVLFLCVHNAGRSQMAMGFFQHLAGDQAIAWSGGSEPTSQVNPAAIAAMAERGIDISNEFPKPWTDEVVRAADAVITMGCGDACPLYPGKRYEDWELSDPAEAESIEQVRAIREEIRGRVEVLLGELGIPAERAPASDAGRR
jgi:arsenate reductase (thioredoxin)